MTSGQHARASAPYEKGSTTSSNPGASKAMDKKVTPDDLSSAADNRRFMQGVRTAHEEQRLKSDTPRLNNMPVLRISTIMLRRL